MSVNCFLGVLYKGWLIACIVISLVSCKSEVDSATYTVTQRNFVDKITVEGVAEPVMSTPLMTPMYCDGVIEYLVEDGIYVKAGDLICQIKFQDLQVEYDAMLINMENAQAGINKAKASLNLEYALLEAQVRNNEADTKIASLDSTQIAYLTPTQRRIKQLELERVTIDKNRFDKKLKVLSFIQQTEIKKMELEIRSFANYIQTIKERLEQMTLRAPKDGLIIISNSPVTDNKFQIGDPVWSNMTIAIIPENSTMKVKLRASETDYKYISVGDSVVYTFDAMPGNIGMGKILMKAPMGVPYRRNSKVKFFEIEASLDSAIVLPEPGFSTNCHIILKHVESAISVPRISVFEEDSAKVVYVKRKNGGYEMRQVETGLTSLSEAVVLVGLNDGETVSLSKPKASQVKRQVMLPDSLRIKPDSTSVHPDLIDVGVHPDMIKTIEAGDGQMIIIQK